MIRSCVKQYASYVNYKWPKDISNIVFFNGDRITIEEFAEYMEIRSKALGLR
jgi:hypothetical protein